MSAQHLEVMIDAASRAADVIREIYKTDFEVEYKGPKDPVTLADKRCNELICNQLREAFPTIPIVAEESDPETFQEYRSADQIFFVDPLDGTKEFIKKNGEFVVMIGLVEGDHATTGVVLAPAQNIVWAGHVGHGAWRIDETGVRQPIFASRAESLQEARVLVSRSHLPENFESLLKRIGVRELVPRGSAGLKGVGVAEGEAHIYAGPGRAGARWDVCAPEAIVRAAGGKFTEALGGAYDYRAEDLTNHGGILASASALHAPMVERIRELIAEQ